MANIFLKRNDSCVPKGWGNWAFVDNYVYEDGVTPEPDPKCSEFDVEEAGTTLFNDAPFPKKYLPAKAFWIESVISHCIFEWKFLQPVKELSDGGDDEVDSENDCYEKGKYVYGIGIEPRGPTYNSVTAEIDAPEMGYCVGDIFKQHIYTHLRLEETIEDDKGCTPYSTVVRLYGTPTLQVLQNSKLKPIYVYEDTVVSYYANTEIEPPVGYLDIGLDKKPVNPSGTITINNSIIMKITGATEDGILLVVPAGEPEAGDYYKLDRAWCMEDPFLMSGFWLDSRKSDLDLYVTTHNSPYETGKFMGAYVWSNTSESVSSFNNMLDVGGEEWKFVWFGVTNEYFPTGDRFKEKVEEPGGDPCATEYQDQVEGYIDYTKRDTASTGDLEAFMYNNSFVRVEISTGGDRTRHNWFSPALKDQYIKIGDDVYRIVNHITSHIIDIAKTSVDGTTELNISEYTSYEIINHKAWMITEHYDGDEFDCEEVSSYSAPEEDRWGASSGLFKGDIDYASYSEETGQTEITLDVLGDHCGAWIKNAPATEEFPSEPPPEWKRYNEANNFINRYLKTHDHASSEPVKQYEKFGNWHLVRTYSPEDACETLVQDFEIVPSSIDTEYFPQWPEAFNPYTISFSVKGNASSELSSGDECFIAFDSSFKTVGCERDGQYYLDFGSELDPEDQSSCRDEGDTAPLCLDGGYISNQYFLNIPKDYRIGYCEGKYFGVNGCAAVTYGSYNNNSVFEDYGLYLHLNTIGHAFDSKGIASLYSQLSRKDLVAYEDVNNQKLQLRIASNDFKSAAVKYEFAVGSLKTSSLSGGSLNTSFDRLNKIGLTDIPSGECLSVSFIVSLKKGYQESTHGFAVSGGGDISLQPLIENNCDPADYVYEDAEGGPISPILIPKKPLQAAEEGETEAVSFSRMVPLGARTSIDGIEIEDGGPAIGYYVNDNQTIRKSMGFFDLLQAPDGETYLLFNQDIGPFNVGSEYPLWEENQLEEDGTATVTPSPEDGQTNNSKAQGNAWDKRSGVMMIGTHDAYNWGTPYVDINQEQPDKFLLILNAVEYLTSFYDPLQRTFGIFVKCSNPSALSSEEEDFIAFFSISYLTLAHEAYEMIPASDDDEEFWCCSDGSYEGYDLDAANKREY